MSYAAGRRCLDADSHLMELPDFLRRNAERRVRGRLPALEEVTEVLSVVDIERFEGAVGHSDAQLARLRALGDRVLRGPKWHEALGSFNGSERAEVLDALGFERQVVFSSFCATALFPLADPALRSAGLRAHNRSMAEFCAADPRLLGVGLATLDDPAEAEATIREGLELGLGAFWIPNDAPGGRSPGHPDHDPVWRLLAERGVPFLLHVGSSSLFVGDAWMNDGRADRPSARGGAEVIGSKDLMVIYQPYERFLSVLVLDGVLERFPGLRGGAIEVGAGWVPAMLRRLDHAADIWSRSEPHLAEMRRKPSEQVADQLRFTPYPFEDVGRMISESQAELYLFSTDYPHAEGGRDPLGRFLGSLADSPPRSLDLFFAGNFEALYGAA